MLPSQKVMWVGSPLPLTCVQGGEGVATGALDIVIHNTEMRYKRKFN